MLCHFPQMGRGGREPGTREWVVRGLPYVIVYTHGEAALDVLGVFHCARKERRV